MSKYTPEEIAQARRDADALPALRKMPAPAMTRYQTMTTGGLHGGVYVASNDDDACALASADGYDVVDIIDDGAGLILVVSD